MSKVLQRKNNDCNVQNTDFFLKVMWFNLQYSHPVINHTKGNCWKKKWIYANCGIVGRLYKRFLARVAGRNTKILLISCLRVAVWTRKMIEYFASSPSETLLIPSCYIMLRHVIMWGYNLLTKRGAGVAVHKSLHSWGGQGNGQSGINYIDRCFFSLITDVHWYIQVLVKLCCLAIFRRMLICSLGWPNIFHCQMYS